jgi:hypothetical protein
MAKFDLVVAAKTVGAGSIKRLGNSMQGVAGRVKNLRLAMGGLNKTFATFGILISGGAFIGLVKGAIDSADSFGKLSDQTGIAANTLQAYVNAGKLAGVSQETIDKGLRRLAQSMREADQGVATYKDSFDALGISVRATDGTFKTSQQVLGEVADKFATMENGATKAAIAMEIFGRSGASLINLLNGGAASLEEFNYEVSENFAQNAEFFNDQIAVLAIRFDGFRKQLTDALLPTLNSVVKVFSNLFSAENDFSGFFNALKIGITGISVVALATVKLFDEFGRVAVKTINFVSGIFENLFKGLAKLFRGFVNIINKEFNRIEARKIANIEFETKLEEARGSRSSINRIMKERDEYIQEVFNRLQQQDASLPTLDLLKPITDKFKSSASDLLNNIFGEDYIKGFVDRLGISIEQFNQLFENTEAPDSYFNNLITKSDEVGESFIKTFGKDMKDKITKFGESIQTVGEAMGDVVVKGIKGMEDALVNFVTTGKLNFRNLANSIIADMARIAIQQTITKPLTNFIGGLFNAKGNVFNQQGLVSAYAKGGVVDKPTFFRYGGAGKLGVLGEAGSEAILPLSRGSNGKLGVQASGGTGTVINVSVDASSTDVSGNANEGNQLGQAIANAVQNELLIQQRPGGLLSAA